MSEVLMNYQSMEQHFLQSRLPVDGVKLPKQKSQKAETLLFLYANMGKVVTKEQAEKHVFEKLNSQPKDLQSLRHLGKQDGFNILQGGQKYGERTLQRGEYVLVDFASTNPFWSFSRRDDSGLDWDSMKRKYNHSCATCGAVEGKKHRYTKQLVVLEKGHMNPAEPMSDSNVIPQCKDCNKVAKNDLVFDQYGRVRKLTIEGILKRQNISDLRELKNILMSRDDL
jgi:hypothetical protein